MYLVSFAFCLCLCPVPISVAVSFFVLVIVVVGVFLFAGATTVSSSMSMSWSPSMSLLATHQTPETPCEQLVSLVTAASVSASERSPWCDVFAEGCGGKRHSAQDNCGPHTHRLERAHAPALGSHVPRHPLSDGLEGRGRIHGLGDVYGGCEPVVPWTGGGEGLCGQWCFSECLCVNNTNTAKTKNQLQKDRR